MMAKLSKQAILKGNVDFYCLLCENHIKNEMMLDKHLLNSVHKTNINAAGYLDKYKDHRIRKVKKGYFCEFCNELLYTAAKVGIHLDDPKHVNKKGTMLVKRVGSDVVVFENIIIEDKAWNGITDDTCIICNTEFENAEIHKSETSHKLNLVQCNTKFETWGIIYRKVDDNSFHCLPCNKVFSNNFFGTHFDANEHKQKCSKPLPKLNEVSVVNRIKTENIDVNVNNTVKNRPLRTPTKKVGIPNEIPVKGISYEYESLICTRLKANSYIVKPDSDIGVFRCILCEKQLTPHAFIFHINDPQHQYLLKVHKRRLDKYAQIEQQEIESEIIQSMQRFLNNNIELDLAKQTAECKLCFKKLGFVSDLIHEHIDYHNKSKIETHVGLKKKDEAKTAGKIRPAKIDPAKREAEKFESMNKITAKIESIKETAAKLDCAKKGSAKYESGNKAVTNEFAKKETEKILPAKKATTDEAATNNAASRASLLTATQKTMTKSTTRSLPKSGVSVTDKEKEHWAIEHNITIDYFQNMAHCNICNLKVPISSKNINEHISGNAHRKLLENRHTRKLPMCKAKPKIIKVATKAFIKSFVLIENVSYQFFIINNKFVITYKSMSFLGKNFRGLRCFLCGDDDIQDNSYAIEKHRTTRKHSVALDNAQVITSFDSEFVRETNSGKFHCGYCNDIDKDWEDLEYHLSTVAHNENKTTAEWRLKEYTQK